MSADCSGTTEESPPILEDLAEAEAEAEEDEDEDAGIFALDGGAGDEDYELELGDAFQLAGFDEGDDDYVGALVTSERKFSSGYAGYEDEKKISQSLPVPPVCRMRSESQNQQLGASPILLSVLEQVAAAQANQGPGGRCRADSC